MFKRKSPIENQIYVRRRLTLYYLSLFFPKKASIVIATSHTAEVSGLKQSLERAEEELGRVKKQLEDKQGMSKPLIS